MIIASSPGPFPAFQCYFSEYNCYIEKPEMSQGTRLPIAYIELYRSRHDSFDNDQDVLKTNGDHNIGVDLTADINQPS